MKPLSNKSILVTRPAENAEHLSSAFFASGGRVIRAPMIELQRSNGLKVKATTRTLLSSDATIFLSVNAVKYSLIGFPKLIPIIARKKIFAVGESTAMKLQSLGLNPIFPEQRATSEGLLELEEMNTLRIKSKTVSILKGVGGRRKLKSVLEKRGASVAHINCYRRVPSGVKIKNALRESGVKSPDVIISTSSTIVKILAEKIEWENLRRLYDTPMVVPSSRVARTARGLGFRGQLIVSNGATSAAIIEAVKSWAWRN